MTWERLKQAIHGANTYVCSCVLNCLLKHMFLLHVTILLQLIREHMKAVIQKSSAHLLNRIKFGIRKNLQLRSSDYPFSDGRISFALEVKRKSFPISNQIKTFKCKIHRTPLTIDH